MAYPLHIVTPEDLEDIRRQLSAELKSIREAVTEREAVKELQFFSVNRLSELLEHHRDTIIKWIETGKKAPTGKMVKLKSYKFSETEYRVFLPDLLEFGQVHQMQIGTHKTKKR